MRRLRSTLIALALLAPAVAQGDQHDNVIDARVRASAEAAESYQGRLDGAWTLTDMAGRPIYDFQLVDRGGRDGLEGAFRSLRRPAVAGDIGFIDSLDRDGGVLTLAFRPLGGGAPVTLILKSAADGDWTGDLRQGPAVTPVQMRKALDF